MRGVREFSIEGLPDGCLNLPEIMAHCFKELREIKEILREKFAPTCITSISQRRI